MSSWFMRVFRAVLIAVAAWILYGLLDRYGHAWVFVPVVCGAFVLWLAEQARRVWVRRKKEAAWDRWEQAIADASARPEAIRQVREALRRSHRFGPRLRQEQAHLSVVLAELLDASGRAREATAVLSKVDIDALTPSQAVVVRHARMVAFLSAGMIDDAEIALSARAKDSGEPDMEARLDLLGAMIAIERGDAARALAIADEVAQRMPGDGGLVAECEVVRAAAHDALGERPKAIEAMRRLDPETLQSLEQLGPPRVRPLATAARS